MAEDNGQVMVGDAAMNSDGARHGFVRDKHGEFHLIDFPGLLVPCTGPALDQRAGVGLFGYVNAVDDCYAGPPLHGFLWRQGKYAALDFPGSTSTVATAINNDTVIVGFYTDEQGVSHGFKSVPREDN